MTTLISPDTELILHVGAPKTGTSAVQRHFHAQADVLRRHGIHYPHHHLDANGVSGGHGDLLAQALAAGPIAGRQAIAQNLAAARRAECRLLGRERVFASAGDRCDAADIPFPRHLPGAPSARRRRVAS